ncbi:MAG: hypothetical protein HQL52_19480 [Magnetococcales bacterium]|nr:hypothetical protein [Magnetococcales bacterium]
MRLQGRGCLAGYFRAVALHAVRSTPETGRNMGDQAMGMKSRRKGATGERELAALLRDHLGLNVTRNLQQSRDGGHDLSGLALALETKRAAKPLLKAWWVQTCEQAKTAGLVPCLAYRLDRQPWRFVMALADLIPDCENQPRSLELTANLSLESFCLLARERWVDGAEAIESP